MLKIEMNPAQLFYSNPCKPKIHLKHAQQKSVAHMTVDISEELVKVRRLQDWI